MKNSKYNGKKSSKGKPFIDKEGSTPPCFVFLTLYRPPHSSIRQAKCKLPLIMKQTYTCNYRDWAARTLQIRMCRQKELNQSE